jgi:hypothetical protein
MAKGKRKPKAEKPKSKAKLRPSNPDPEQMRLERLKAKRTFVDLAQVSPKDDARARAWAAETIRRYESKLTMNVPDGTILWHGHLRPEDVDIQVIYNLSNLYWIIFYRNKLFHISLCSGHRAIFTSSFAQI